MEVHEYMHIIKAKIRSDRAAWKSLKRVLHCDLSKI